MSAAAGRLKDPKVLEQQVRRMLADPALESLVTNFAAQWLYLRDIDAKLPDEILFPDFDETLRAGAAARDRAVPRQHLPREPQRARSADRQLHLPQRAAGQALRHPERPGQLLPPRDAARRAACAAACSARAAS